MTIWTLTIPGRPMPKGSMKCVGGRGPIRHQLVEDDKTGDGKRWRATVTDAARPLAARIGAPLDGHVIVGMLAVIPRPPSARKRTLPNRRSAGDVDKLLRMILDAITDAGVLLDDSRATSTIPAKVYEAPGRPPGAVLYVSEAGPGVHARILAAILTAAPELEWAP